MSVGPPCISGSTHKPLRISAFKGSAQNDESVTRANGLKVPKTSVRLDDSGEAKSEPPKVHNVPLSYASEANETESLSLSPVIHKLFKKWLTMLRTKPSTQEAEEVLGEPPPGVSQETLQGTRSKKSGDILKVAWAHLLALDATIKIPLLIFIPFYMAVNVIYGAEVSRELTPFWVFGPLIVALYVTIIRKLCALYALIFKQTIKVIKNMPSYSILAYSYVFSGKLKEDIRALILQPIWSIKNRDYKELRRRKWKELEDWIVEKYLDFGSPREGKEMGFESTRSDFVLKFKERWENSAWCWLWGPDEVVWLWHHQMEIDSILISESGMDCFYPLFPLLLHFMRKP
ncbi:uncharacterized protein G2W53_038224 [Senna tora]|uniref:Uncharacterized protein n=1 Tax=Senna tora TaxID=362788 RepID=A0A834SKT3_9FABA|nr:uncharacterized protein G2W53_038224 [Senna tora]